MRYCLARIVGNELPPRDDAGSRMKCLKFLLDNEPILPDCEKVWVINQIHDKPLKNQVKTLLSEYKIIEIEFDRDAFYRATSRDEKIVAAININKARNMALDAGKQSRFTFVFDGDCFFTEKLWNETVSEIEDDQLKCNRRYYGVPGVRITDGEIGDLSSLKRWEPSLVFRNDVKLRFDESIPFAKNDKVSLLRKLGYDRERGELYLSGDLCKNVGRLAHVSFGNERVETDLAHRMKMREISVDRLIYNLAGSNLPLL